LNAATNTCRGRDRRHTAFTLRSLEGLLREKLGVPGGQKIPESKLQAAKHSKSPAEREEVNFALNFGHKKEKVPLQRNSTYHYKEIARTTTLNSGKLFFM
jgi:hypothetical protein